MEPINVLSLFDGCATGLYVLKSLGVPVAGYYASEIDKHAMAVAKANHPEIIHIGDVRGVSSLVLPDIDLLIGGSPCQGFSFAGNRLNFDDPRSKLFFEYARLLEELRPRWFFLENVRMAKVSEQAITDILGVEPVRFNSKLVSAQSRPRLYWTNIPHEPMPVEDSGIVLRDILEDAVGEKYYVKSPKLLQRIERKKKGGPGSLKLHETKDGKASCLLASDHEKGNNGNFISDPVRVATWNKGGQGERIYSGEGKSPCLGAQTGGCGSTAIFAGAIRGRRLDEEGNRKDGSDHPIRQRFEANADPEKTGCLTTVQKDNVVAEPPRIRKLTEIECERLQGWPDNYTAAASSAQRYKMAGNGWQSDTIKLFFKGLLNA